MSDIKSAGGAVLTNMPAPLQQSTDTKTQYAEQTTGLLDVLDSNNHNPVAFSPRCIHVLLCYSLAIREELKD